MKIKNEIGFTLVDLVIGLMIMGILAAFAAPQFSGLIRSYRLTGAARMVWLDLHKAKMTAIKERRTIRVDFTPTLYNLVRVDTAVVAFSRNLSGDYPGITVSLDGTAQSVSFTSTGTLLPPSRTVQIQGPAGSKSFTIITTGRIGNIS